MGNEVSVAESRQMNISETQKCYVYGQCQEYSLNFKVTQDAEGCHKFCGKNQECNWWSWEPAFELCMLFAKCTDVEDCQWFTLEKANDHCILYEECNDQFDC